MDQTIDNLLDEIEEDLIRVNYKLKAFKDQIKHNKVLIDYVSN